MSSLAIMFGFLSWDPERQVHALPGVVADSGSVGFSFDVDNPVVRLAKIVSDLHFPREGESSVEWRERLGINQAIQTAILEDLYATLEGVQVIFELMRRAEKDSLFTAHGISKAAAWRLLRKLATHGKKCLGDIGDPTESAINSFLRNYDFGE